MKKAGVIITIVSLVAIFAGCHSNPKKSFGGPAQTAKDTAASKRDTSSASH